MFPLTAIFSVVSGWFTSGGSWIKWAGIGILLVIVFAAGALHWNDYQRAKHDAAAYKTLYDGAVSDLRNAAEIERQNIEAWDRERASLKKDLALSARVSSARLDRMHTLAGQIAQLKKIERPDHEKDCPIHPAVAAAFDILREQATGPEAGSDPEAGSEDEDPATGIAPVHGRSADSSEAVER